MHLEDSATVELGVSALWSLVHDSDELRACLVRATGCVDTFTEALVRHSDVPDLVEKVSGILSVLSSSHEIASRVVSASSVGTMVNTFINNKSRTKVQHFCLIYIKNAIVVKPRLSSEGSAAIPYVLSAMQGCRATDDFQKCACLLLWVLALASSDCKCMILEAGGCRVLRETMEASAASSGVRDAAHGTLQELLHGMPV